jgi:thymidylate synthase ThyX
MGEGERVDQGGMASTVTKPSARVLLDSISPGGHRLTTMEVVLHRFILSELNTHRAFSRNSASSRAIPVEKRLREYRDDPAFPLSYPAEQPGMQGGDELTGIARDEAEDLLNDIMRMTNERVERYLSRHPNKAARLHKSVLNRYLEPFLWHTVIVSSTEWQNFFDQRCSPLAQPEIRIPAEMMREALANSTPQAPRDGWHTPLILPEEYETIPIKDRVKVSVGRCARVSYLTHEGVRDVAEDLRLYERLVSADPPHWSPLEHVARPAVYPEYVAGNFEGWVQLRQRGSA